MHIVVFPGWYPNKADKLSGDFIQRHMYAIAQNCTVSVVFPVKDNTISNDVIDLHTTNKLTEIKHYYPARTSVKKVDAIMSFIKYNWLCYKYLNKLNKKEKVSVVHLYVLQKNFLVGFIGRLLFSIPFLVSEQSTFYVDGRFDKLSNWQKKGFSLVFNKCASFHAVSGYLVEAIKNKLKLNKEGVIIPNVVDSDLFYYFKKNLNNKLAFVHVSNMTFQKNVEGMLRAFTEVKKITSNFKLNLVGPLPEHIRQMLTDFNLNENIVCWNERNYEEVAQIVQSSDVFVFFTRYETFGCVIIEANACGLPVIVTDLQVTRELIEDNHNGVFVEDDNVIDLASKIIYMINHYKQFDPITISEETRRKFNYERIGKQFFDWYSTFI